MILAGRRINDDVGQRVALECVQTLFRRQRTNAVVTVLGMTFKENVPDTRNSKVVDIVRELRDRGRRRAGARSAGARPMKRSTNTASR